MRCMISSLGGLARRPFRFAAPGLVRRAGRVHRLARRRHRAPTQRRGPPRLPRVAVLGHSPRLPPRLPDGEFPGGEQGVHRGPGEGLDLRGGERTSPSGHPSKGDSEGGGLLQPRYRKEKDGSLVEFLKPRVTTDESFPRCGDVESPNAATPDARTAIKLPAATDLPRAASIVAAAGADIGLYAIDFSDAYRYCVIHPSDRWAQCVLWADGVHVEERGGFGQVWMPQWFQRISALALAAARHRINLFESRLRTHRLQLLPPAVSAKQGCRSDAPTPVEVLDCQRRPQRGVGHRRGGGAPVGHCRPAAGVFATRPTLRETNPSNSTLPDAVRGRSEEAGEGKPTLRGGRIHYGKHSTKLAKGWSQEEQNGSCCTSRFLSFKKRRRKQIRS